MRKLPKFRSEKEEADWWYKNRKKLDVEFFKAFREGKVTVLTREKLLARIKAASQTWKRKTKHDR